MPDAQQTAAPRPMQTPWTRDIESCAEELHVELEEGLSTSAVEERHSKYGRNKLREAEKKSGWAILLDQFKSIIMALLAAAIVVSFLLGNWIDGIAIIIVVVVTVAIGFFTEWSGRRSMEKLQELGTTETAVRRNGQATTIEAEELVPGDLLLVSEGDVITADARLIEANQLQADESALTGESVPVDKQVDVLEEETPLAERENMIFKGTAVTRGSGKALVVATGMETELGQISELAEEAEEEVTPLEKRLDQLGKTLVWVVIGLSALILVVGLMTGQDTLQIVETAVALAVAAVPEGLPIVATVALARGMWRMARRNALVEQLTAVETLGSTNLIFTDKTGTLTENQMTVTHIQAAEQLLNITGRGLEPEGGFYPAADLDDNDKNDKNNEEGQEEALDAAENEWLQTILETGVLCNNASLNHTADPDDETEEEAVGEPLEIALLVAGAKADLHRDDLLEKYPEAEEVAFDPEINMMATFHEQNGRYRVAVKGSSEAVLDTATAVYTGGADGETQQLDDEQRKWWLAQNDKMAAKGLRVIALATREADSTDEDPYQELILLGLFGLVDPPREDVRESINAAQQAGIQTVMVTGDHPGTAANIGAAVGLIDSREEANIVRGNELIPPEDLAAEERERFLAANIFARVTPEQKLNLIALHQNDNSIVAMTGDGVNDAPALQKADIGVAMGERGTDVAQEAADVVLQDDAFHSITVAIEYGRVIFANIRKFTLYLISGNVGEIVAVALATLTNLPLPLLPLQILYINVLNDVFPSLALGLGDSLPGVMEKPPRDTEEPIMTRDHWIAITAYGFLIGGVVLGALLIALFVLGLDETAAVTISFLTVTFSRLWHVFNMRSQEGGFFVNEVTRNKFVWGALLLCTALLLLTVYWPPFANILSLTNPGVNGWLVIMGMSIIPVIVGQVVKLLKLDRVD